MLADPFWEASEGTSQGLRDSFVKKERELQGGCQDLPHVLYTQLLHLPSLQCSELRPASVRTFTVKMSQPDLVAPLLLTLVPSISSALFPLLQPSVPGLCCVRAGTPVAGPAGRDLFAEGLLEFLRPAVQQLDSHVHAVRESQVELREQIDNLATELCRINEDQKVALDLDPYVKKLLNARRRVVLVNNILQNAQERLRRLNHSVAKETARRRAMLDSGVYPSGSPSK
ncbi:SNARE-associated protein Snapin [Puma concolor]|uniref:Biogenesis of lysosome-related organelles complex 1 subunit 7 n=1 Tax=Puma concolor TaxID=9696 RepID=A0A6P6H5H4_PUMCO|nr:SNARE-associated protein Snapin [Puma concolor]